MDVLNDINWALVAPLLILQAILTISALVSCIKQKETNGPKWMWILLILFVNLFGAILYFVIGRKNS
ncbi:PLD nuclease N-terminal domain-containing protein [Guptibacillus hwajinpoensis]|uniref:PLD nuclease N-terminal domain-containing protein n=1 Tax=Guptibacillus hwajinpoensis TaxID=208199 RepID=UPI001CFF511A|nr:PLD nuclease N-terminal domain-containing protein [Pseudalkalibacillus hwajinpoensis]WLR59096.1 PLD nuclease N-terminal domain-containing protein [Pseudalkalibacillus hwajinpoensis]